MPATLKIKYKLLLSAILLFTILISSIAASWIVKKSQRDSLLDLFTRTEQVVETLLSAQRSKLVNQAMLVGILPILSTVVENGDTDTILDTAQGYQKQLDVPIFDIFDDAGDLLVSLDNSFTIGEKTEHF